MRSRYLRRLRYFIDDCRACGLRGTLVIVFHKLLGYPKELSVRYNTAIVRLRFDTIDRVVHQRVLVRKEYDIDLGFTPKVIIDAGANIGLTSLFYAKKYPDARIIAVEPEASNFAMLVKNVGKYPQIVPLQAALWSHDGVVTITQAEGKDNSDTWAFVTRESNGKADANVSAMTFPTLLKSLQIASVDLLKVDIEGAEKPVFESCDWMDRVRAMVIETHDRIRPGCRTAVQDAARGFSRLEHEELTVYLRP